MELNTNKIQPTSKALKEILSFFKLASQEKLLVIGSQLLRHLSADSRQIKQGDCFIALQGEQSHGLDFLSSVLKKRPGLVISDAVLTQAQNLTINQHNQALSKEGLNQVCQVLVVSTLASQLASFADWFYEQPSQRLKVVGITGTNGKTSTAFYTAQLLESLGQTTALIGTLGNGLLGNLQPTRNTTPDVVIVHRLLAKFYELGAQWVLMEVSSHALVLGRIACVEFEVVALTQVARDHLDFHKTEADYCRAKALLFSDYKTKQRVVNINDNVGQKIIETATENIWRYSINEAQSEAPYHQKMPIAELVCQQYQLDTQGIKLSLGCEGVNASKLQTLNDIRIPLIGRFNIENILCASSILLSSGFAFNELVQSLLVLKPVVGRMQQVINQPTVIVDFAHAPAALEQVLLAVHEHLTFERGQPQQATLGSKLWVIFGCGGDRDQGKRPLMAAIAERLANEVMVTDDNPRFEVSEVIIEQIMRGFLYANKVSVQADRKLAIEAILERADKKDIILIAGKGHEAYQDIRGVKIAFSDVQTVLAWQKRTL